MWAGAPMNHLYRLDWLHASVHDFQPVLCVPLLSSRLMPQMHASGRINALSKFMLSGWYRPRTWNTVLVYYMFRSVFRFASRLDASRRPSPKYGLAVATCTEVPLGLRPSFYRLVAVAGGSGVRLNMRALVKSTHFYVSSCMTRRHPPNKRTIC